MPENLHPCKMVASMSSNEWHDRNDFMSLEVNFILYDVDICFYTTISIDMLVHEKTRLWAIST